MSDKVNVSAFVGNFNWAPVDSPTLFSDIDRVEVIDAQGRSYVNMNVKECGLMLQDNNKTLKLFLK